MTLKDEDEIIEAFFDIYNEYLDLQYVIELCQPYWDLENGRMLIDDLLRVAMQVGLKGEALVSTYDILSSPKVLGRMGDGIAQLADKISQINWPPHMQTISQIYGKDISEYISTALLSPESKLHTEGFDGREWDIARLGARKYLTVRNSLTKEWNGAHVVWEDGQVKSISVYDNDSPVFTVYVYGGGVLEAYQRRPPVSFEIETENPADESAMDDNSESSDAAWGTVLAGTVGGLVLASLLGSSKKNSSKSIEQKEHSRVVR